MTWVQLLLNVGLHGLFIWGRYAVFRIDGRTPRGARLIEVAAVASILAGLLLIGLRDGPDDVFDPMAAAVAGLSGGLFLWAVRTVYRDRLTAAFSDDLPRELIAAGPYRWVRNPFYLSYLLAYVHAAVASRSPWAVVPLLLMAGIYGTAAVLEERKFACSDFAEAYRAYARRTGRFLPWVF